MPEGPLNEAACGGTLEATLLAEEPLKRPSLRGNLWSDRSSPRRHHCGDGKPKLARSWSSGYRITVLGV